MTHAKQSWPIGRLALAAGLLLAGLALVLGPSEAQVKKLPPLPVPADLKLVPTDALFFGTVRVADLKRNELVQKALEAGGKRQEEKLKEALKVLLVPPETVERATVVLAL